MRKTVIASAAGLIGFSLVALCIEEDFNFISFDHHIPNSRLSYLDY